MQGLKAKVLFAMSALGMIILIGVLVLLSHQKGERVQQQALSIAESVTSQVSAEQFVYAAKVVQKLEQDGTGAAPDAQNKLGYIHVPAQFVRSVAERVASSNRTHYQYRLLSEWCYRPENGIVDDFERWAWDRLKEQETTFKANGTEPDRQFGYAWQPVYRIEQTPNGSVLRLMAALPASTTSCLGCHNKLEQSPEVAQLRQAASNGAQKQWQLHDLMGGVALTVPLQEFEQTASADRNLMLAGFVVSFLLVTVVVAVIVSRNGIAPMKTAAATLAGHSAELEQSAQKLMSLNRDLALATEQEQQSLKQMDFVKEFYSQDRTVQNMIESASLHLEKAKQLTEQGASAVEQSAMACREIERDVEEIKKANNRLREIIGDGKNH